MASLTLVITTPKDTSKLMTSTQPRTNLNRLINLLSGLLGGKLLGKLVMSYSTSDAVAASGTITLASVLADDTVTIGKTTLTAKASPSGENQFSQAGTDTQDAASLVTKINAHSVLGLICQATSVAGVVTVTMTIPGKVGNEIALTSSNGTRLAVSGSGYLSGGTGGAGSAPYTIGRN